MNYKDVLIGKLTEEEILKLDDSTIMFVRLKQMARNSSGLFDFDGQNCDDVDGNACGGWDGESRRCECGNRRVYWELSDDKKYMYGQAY